MVALLTVVFAVLLAVMAAPPSSPFLRRSASILADGRAAIGNATGRQELRPREEGTDDSIPLLIMPPRSPETSAEPFPSPESPVMYTTVTETVTTTLLSQIPATTVILSVAVPPETTTIETTDTTTVTSTVFAAPTISPDPPLAPMPLNPPQDSRPGPPSRDRLPNLPGIKSWTCPWVLKDLGPFKVTQTGSKQNLRFVTGIPPQARSSLNSDFTQQQQAIKASSPESNQAGAISNWHPDEVSLQLLYPKGSVNPARKPQGGISFYASPIDIRTARTVTLRYSVYFPKGFAWVLGGKLPGLYGGHTGCSGGNAALDCFSTRLMWRKDGLGEMYLYASKEKQTKALCSHPQSSCNALYGFSIGRGSFKWTTGQWTTVEQTVSLNTPGRQDGVFRLLVNGRKVLERTDVFYRDILWPGAPAPPSIPKPPAPPSRPTPTKRPKPPPKPTKHTYGDDPLGDILGPLLSQIGKLIQRDGVERTELARTTYGTSSLPGFTAVEDAPPLAQKTQVVEGSSTEEAQVLLLSPAQTVLDPHFDDLDSSGEDAQGENEANIGMSIFAAPERVGNSIGFCGIFFSTFFGGHDDKYATPRDQYVWFKDFALAYVD